MDQPALLDLDALGSGTPGITRIFGAMLCEAASVSMEMNAHASGVVMGLFGCLGERRFTVVWPTTAPNAAATYNDPQVAAEFGAYGVAVLIVETLTTFTVAERSRKGTGFDFWLAPKGNAAPLFQDKCKLEVSGMHQGDESAFKTRLRQKIAQMKAGNVALPGYGVVVHFPRPETRAEQE